jgi:hypothetical protein
MSDIPDGRPDWRGISERSMRDSGAAPQSQPEEYSRRVQFDKYHAMQSLLHEIANATNVPIKFVVSARDILAGMKMPRGPDTRAQERKAELEALAYAYGVINHVGGKLGSLDHRAATIALEALKAYERAHPPAPLDPLLL